MAKQRQRPPESRLKAGSQPSCGPAPSPPAPFPPAPSPPTLNPANLSPYADQEQKALRLFGEGEWQKAEQICRNLLQINHISVDIFTCLAAICGGTNRIDAGIDYLSQANTLQPDNPNTLANLGMLLYRKGDLDSACHLYQEALTFQPNHPHALINLGTVYLEQGELDKGITYFQEILAACPDHPDYPEILFNLANAYHLKDDFSKAIEIYRKVIALRPGLGDAHSNLGAALESCGDFELAKDVYLDSLSQGLDDPKIHLNYSMLLLRERAYQQGWKEYEWRARVYALNYNQSITTRPIWQPDLSTERLVLWPEQGMGDVLLFCSMLSDAKALARRLIVPTYPRLLPLLKRSIPGIDFLDSTRLIPETDYDSQLLMGDLGQYLRRSTRDFPTQRSHYLNSDPQRCRELQSSLSRTGQRLVGISWRSFSKRTFKRRIFDIGPAKSIPLASLAAVLAQEGIRLVSLQYGEVEAEIRALKDDTGIEVITCRDVDPLNDLDGLAALLSACDLVITTSSTTAHLAGALGAPTWVLASVAPLWYLGIDGETTPWYPSLRLFRQRQRGDWDEPLECVKQELRRHDWTTKSAWSLPSKLKP